MEVAKMRIADGKTSFYQWDHDQQLIVSEDCTEVHFDNGTQPKALCCEVKKDGKVDVPNILLQTAAQIHAYGWNKNRKCVVQYACFWVEPREKPDDYVYTETEILTWEALDRRITALERGGGGGGEGGFSPIVTVEPIAGGHRVTIIDAVGEQTFDIMDGKDGAPGSNGKDGYTPVRGKDYWTEQDKNEIKSYVDEAILGGEW
jgi:hypothetical protein